MYQVKLDLWSKNHIIMSPVQPTSIVVWSINTVNIYTVIIDSTLYNWSSFFIDQMCLYLF
jgi:hypothetical protein